jgi:hypothetical protein
VSSFRHSFNKFFLQSVVRQGGAARYETLTVAIERINKPSFDTARFPATPVGYLNKLAGE